MKNTLFIVFLVNIVSINMAFAASLHFPVQCELGKNCYVQKYVDHDPDAGGRDFTGGRLSNAGHRGTDINLSTHAEAEKGIPVIAAASGEVLYTKNRYTDRIKKYHGTLSTSNCGNYIVIQHAHGLQTEYCHLRKNSIRVVRGQEVTAGEVIAEVGSSGFVDFPGLGFFVLENDKVIDPFSPNIWDPPIPYKGTGIIDIGISKKQPSFSDLVKDPQKLSSVLSNVPVYPWVRLFGMPAETEQRFMFYDTNNKLFRKIELPPSNQFYPSWFAYTLFDVRHFLGVEEEGEWIFTYQIKMHNKDEWETVGEYPFELVTFSRHGRSVERHPGKKGK